MTAPKTTAVELEETLRMMDVADQLRRMRRRVEEHFEETDREKLREQLLERYRAMGHAADPALLDEAIETVLAQRNRFRPPAPGLGTRMAHLYVRRRELSRKIGVPVLVLAVLAGLVWAGLSGVRAIQAGRAEQAREQVEHAVDRADSLLERVRSIAEEPRAIELAEGYHAEVGRAAAAGEGEAAERATADLERLLERLEQSYTLIIVRGRERDDVRHYLIVQAVADDGSRVAVPIRNEETGATEEVTEWGERVPRELYERVGRDYADDRVIDDDVFGRKRRGFLEPERDHPSAGRITRW